MTVYYRTHHHNRRLSALNEPLQLAAIEGEWQEIMAMSRDNMHRRKSVPDPLLARGEIGIPLTRGEIISHHCIKQTVKRSTSHSSRVCISNLVATYEQLTSAIDFTENCYTMAKTMSTSPTSTSTALDSRVQVHVRVSGFRVWVVEYEYSKFVFELYSSTSTSTKYYISDDW